MLQCQLQLTRDLACRYVRQKPLGAGKGDEQNHHHYHFGAQAMVGEPGTTSDSAAALLYPIDYMVSCGAAWLVTLTRTLACPAPW